MPPQPPASPTPASRLVSLGRFAVQALRISASTVAVVALLRQQWLTGACFTIAWLLILAAPRVLPNLYADTPAPVKPPD